MKKARKSAKTKTKTVKKPPVRKGRRMKAVSDGWDELDKPTGGGAAGGPIKMIRKFDIMDSYKVAYMSEDDVNDLMSKYSPRQSLQRVDPQTYRVLTAAQMTDIAKRTKEGSKTTSVYANPMQHLDYRIYETILKTTFIGSLTDTFLRYVIGSGFKPELEVIHPSSDKEADKKLIEDNQQVIRDLLEIDRQVDGLPPTNATVSSSEGVKPDEEGKKKKDEKPKNGEDVKNDTVNRMLRMAGVDGESEKNKPTAEQKDAEEMSKSLDVSFKQKMAACIGSTLWYNRGALHFRYTKPITIRGVDYEGVIPNVVTFAHAQDLGMIKVDDETGAMTDVQIRTRQEDYTSVQDMIYLWNPVTSAKVHNSWFYGTSMLSPLITASKMLRTLLSETFPAMAKSTWAGVFFITIKNEGNTQASKQAEYQALANNFVTGGPNILIHDPEGVKLENVDFEPKITELRELAESMIKLAISAMGLPQVAFYDESASNRSTMVGKIQLVLRTTIEPMREWIGEEIAKQWYGRWFRYLYADQPELLSKLRIKINWADLHISEWTDSIDGALELDSRKQLKDVKFGDLLGMPDYPTMTEEDAETVPGGTGAGGGGSRFENGEMGGEGGAPFGKVKSTSSSKADGDKGEKASEAKGKKV